MNENTDESLYWQYEKLETEALKQMKACFQSLKATTDENSQFFPLDDRKWISQQINNVDAVLGNGKSDE